MQEVVVRLRFTRECLGSTAKRKKNDQVVYCMPRDPLGRVIFLPTWWKSRMEYAANVSNSGQSLVAQIAWGSVVDGTLRPDWRRTVIPARDDPRKRARFAVHEAFQPGSEITVTAVLPGGLSADQFRDLLSIIGTYKGISPFVDDKVVYGTFEVLSVEPVNRASPRSSPAGSSM